MSEDPKNDSEESQPAKQDKGMTFDMYHFFSRKDVLLIALLVILVLWFLLFKFAFTPVMAS